MYKSTICIRLFPVAHYSPNERTDMVSLGALHTRRKAQPEERQLPAHEPRQRASSVEGVCPVFGLPVN